MVYGSLSLQDQSEHANVSIMELAAYVNFKRKKMAHDASIDEISLIAEWDALDDDDKSDLVPTNPASYVAADAQFRALLPIVAFDFQTCIRTEQEGFIVARLPQGSPRLLQGSPRLPKASPRLPKAPQGFPKAPQGFPKASQGFTRLHKASQGFPRLPQGFLKASPSLPKSP